MLPKWILYGIIFLATSLAYAQEQSHAVTSELHLHLVTPQHGRHHGVPAVIWLDPAAGTTATPFVSDAHYTLLQKNRTFLPHFQVVPVGSSVEFPNADPFFHNVFSLFDGKRFDLGLYEAGSSKSVTFSREGVSYIFCNIHPEMSAVIISIPTRLYAVADSNGFIQVRDIPPGEYKMQIWAEGVPQSLLGQLTKNVRLRPGVNELGDINLPIPARAEDHTNKFGKPYEQAPQTPY